MPTQNINFFFFPFVTLTFSTFHRLAMYIQLLSSSSYSQQDSEVQSKGKQKENPVSSTFRSVPNENGVPLGKKCRFSLPPTLTSLNNRVCSI